MERAVRLAWAWATPITAKANTLLNDLEHHPHAFVLACLVDRQDIAERAWTLPYRLGERAGSWELADLAALSPEAIAKHILEPDALHRYPVTIAPVVYAALQRIVSQYGGDAGCLWADSPSSAAVVRRFLEFDGCGPKIATMAVNILVRDFRVPVSDKYSIDVSVDVHVRRVMRRLGLVRPDCSDEEIIYRAREMNPKFPGVIDLGLWELELRRLRISWTRVCVASVSERKVRHVREEPLVRESPRPRGATRSGTALEPCPQT